MLKVITLLNEKGGCGKTTISTHLAVGLAIQGRKVILVDIDPQANATQALGLPPQPLVHDLIVRTMAWKDALRPISREYYALDGASNGGALLCVPGDIESRNIALNISSNAIIRQRFAEMRNAVDYIIVDTAPTPGLINEAIISASDYVILPTKPEEFDAFIGVPNALEHVNNVHQIAAERGHRIAQPLGIIPNMYRAKTASHQYVMQEMKRTHGDLMWEPINLAAAFVEAQLQGQFVYHTDSRAADQMWSIVDRVLQMTEVHHG